MKTCLNCGSKTKRKERKYCSIKCQKDFERTKKINAWLRGEVSGMRGKTAIARWIKWWLIDTYGEKCGKCGWNERNEFTGNIPLEINHKDGNFKNNKSENLELICPNCHSLTSTYRALNMGNGRPRK